MSGYRNYYDSTFVRSRSSEPSSKKVSDEKIIPSRIATKYTGSYTSANRDAGAYSARAETPRIKTSLDTSHPPVSYKSVLKTGARSRDPSPVERSEKSSSSSSSYYNPNRLYPRPYTKSVSRETTLSPASSTTNLPKYTGRASFGRDDVMTKYGGRSAVSKDDVSNKSRSKDETIPTKYKSSTGRTTSKEDLSSSSQKSYINSRFLPKNSVEKSYTAFTRPSNIRTHETSRKNRELLNVLQVQEPERTSRPSSRGSSMTPEECINQSIPTLPKQAKEKVEMETVTLITRSTSPNLTKQSPSFLRSRRVEFAKTVEKQITRPKIKKEQSVDKSIQSDRLDDSTKSSRFAGASRISATPWSSFLDLKFSSPNQKQNNVEYEITLENQGKEACDSPKSLSRTSSSKSIGQSLSKGEKIKDNKKALPTSPVMKSKLSPPKPVSDNKKQLPPPIPKSESSTKTNSLHSLNTPNKDFRKSVLNMNPDGTAKKKLGRRSTSVSSAESDNADPDATDVSENLTSCKSYHKTNSSKLPQKVSSDKNHRNRRSPSSDVSISSVTVSSSEDDTKNKEKIKLKSAGSSRTSMILSSADELSVEKCPKPPQSPRLKNDSGKPDTEGKSFLMRALAPVTNLFKANKGQPILVEKSELTTDSNSEEHFIEASSEQDKEKVIWILDPSSENTTTQSNSSLQYTCNSSEPKSAKIIIHRVESMGKPWWDEYNENSNKDCQPRKIQSEPIIKVGSGERPWWPEKKLQNQHSESMTPETGQDETTHQKYLIRNVSSSNKPWWLDENSDIPEGVDTYPEWTQQQQQEYNVDQNIINQKTNNIKPVHSGEIPWWLDNNAEPPEGVQVYPGWSENDENIQNPKRPVIRHVNSGGNTWWLEEDQSDNSEGIRPDDSNSQKQILSAPKAKIRPVDSGEIPWWLDSNGQPPEGVQTYPNWVQEDGTTQNGKAIYKLRQNDSGNSTWWLDSDKSESQNATSNVSNFETGYQDKYKLRHIDSGERDWWQGSSENVSEMVQAQEDVKPNQAKYAIRHQDSGEKAWWLQQNECNSDGDYDSNIPLGDRASPEGLEMPKDRPPSPYDNVPSTYRKGSKVPSQLFISKHTNIDDILGGSSQLWSPFMNKVFGYGEEKHEDCLEINANQVIIHEGVPKHLGARLETKKSNNEKVSRSSQKLDDAALQLYKDGDYGSYLDLEASISEQQEEFEGFQSNKKNSIVLRTQLSVRVHTIIEKLLTSEGRELRRALFSLKQIFQEDKDLVHEFVQNDGLSCLIKVGSEADQNYQNYILRALGQVMLYVDGMNGVMEHNQTIQWLYSLISSKFRLVVKTALKLLLVFVEYTESNCFLLIKAIHTVDYSQGLLPFHNIMRLLKDFDSADTELLIYATTLINKVLNGSPDQDTYYDQVDALEEQGIENIIQRYMSKPGTDLDLLQQFQIYEAVLQYEDGEEINGTPIRHLDENIRKTLRNRKSVGESVERRKSRRHSTGTTPIYGGLNGRNNNSILQVNHEDFDESSSSQSSGVNNAHLNGSYKDSNKAIEAGVTPALKRRRERAERQRSFMKEQQENAAFLKGSPNNKEESNENTNGTYTNALQQRIANGNLLNRNSSRKDLTSLLNAANKLDSEDSLKQPWIYSMLQNQENLEESEVANENEKNLLIQLKKENTVKDLTQKLANQSILPSPTDDNKINRFGDMSGLISKAKEGLAKSKSKADVLKCPTSENIPKAEPKKSENELRWEELVSNLNRSLNLCDMDFTDLGTDDETDVLAPATVTNGIPPPPPPLMDFGSAPPPPPLTNRIPPPVPTAPLFGAPFQRNKPSDTKIPIKKNKKTVKLFWKEVRDDPVSHTKLKTGFIWDELNPVAVDTQKLEHLFESRAKDLITKKQQEMNKNKEIIVLDPKRSNAINIGMTKLPPPRSIKTAILKMDATIMNREGIEKLLTMLPTEEERSKIQEAQAANPDLPLGSAEQFLLTLASISELPARLKLWAFKLDFENSEREIAEPLMDLKQGFEVLKVNKTFRGILSTLLSIGNFLNGNEVKGFQIDYLAKVPEVKDTVHKHSLLHHLCHIVMEKFPEATDLYSEIGAITRASKIDFDELTLNIHRLESDCKASWDHLKLIAKHDGSTMMKVKMSDFLADCAERIILLGIIHRRIMNRFHKFLLWLGIPLHQIADTKPNEFCRIVSEFALEYRTTRERVLQQLEKKANHRERNKTRGKMITDVGKFRTKEDRADAELRQLLGNDMSDVESLQGTLTWRRTRRDGNRPFVSPGNGNFTDGDDEILESLVKTATKGPSVRTAPRERKRTRHADRKSLRRTLKNGLSEEEKKHLSAYIKGY